MPRRKIIPVSRRRFEKFLVQCGCVYIRTSGDHVIYEREGVNRPIVFQADPEITPYIIRNNLKTLGISRDDYLEAMAKIK